MLVCVAKPTRHPAGRSSAIAVTTSIGYSSLPMSSANASAVLTLGRRDVAPG